MAHAWNGTWEGDDALVHVVAFIAPDLGEATR
jgi:hypothetical protein